jgi:limonene-1,2-epoxide hydrolase
MPTSQRSTKPSTSAAKVAPADVVVEFLEAWSRFDIDRVLELVTEDLEYINVSLPTVHGRERLERFARPLIRPDRFGFNAYLHHVATDGDVVLTDRVDELTFRKWSSRFWVYGRFVVRDGQIAVWRDSFDWLDVTIGNFRGLLGIVAPALNRRMPGR